MFPLSAQFEKTVSSDDTLLAIDMVSSNQVKFGKGDKLFKTAKEAFQNAYGTKTTVHIKQLGMDVDLYQSIAQESISKIVGIYDVHQTLDAIPNLKTILSNSVLLGVERLSHTDNKNQGLFGLRMYNFYEYRKGNKKIPGCLVCTVVKELTKSEGHIFKTIENVTLDRSLPGNKPGMSSATSGDTYTIAQLYDAVKKISREEGGLNIRMPRHQALKFFMGRVVAIVREKSQYE